MSFVRGQQIKFKDAGGTATVLRMDGALVVVEDEFGFEHSYEVSEVLPLEELAFGSVMSKEGEKRISGASQQQVDRLVVDLHSHELIENTRGMTRYEILNTQLDKAAETIREARRRKVAKVLIIHGKGSGRLQTEVHDLLSKLGNLEFYFADFTDGGYGATEVRLFNGGV